MNKSHALAELLVGIDERRLRNSIRCLFLHRLYQDWEPELLRPRDALTTWNDDEMRDMDTVIMQDFFGNAFVLAKGKTGRAAAGERQALHFEKRNDVLIEARIVPELLDEVEKNIGSEGFQFLAKKIDIVVDREMLRRVAERAKRCHDVRLGLPVLCLQLLREILIDGCRTCAVEKHQHFKFLFHVVLSSLSFGAFEFPGEKIIHHQRGDKCGDAKILLRIVVVHMESQLVGTFDQSR